MKFEIIYTNAILNYLINHIRELRCCNETYGSCQLHQFLTDLFLFLNMKTFQLIVEKRIAQTI